MSEPSLWRSLSWLSRDDMLAIVTALAGAAALVALYGVPHDRLANDGSWPDWECAYMAPYPDPVCHKKPRQTET